jgi:hypothetical protein
MCGRRVRIPAIAKTISDDQTLLLYAPSYDECFQSAKSVVSRKISNLKQKFPHAIKFKLY